MSITFNFESLFDITYTVTDWIEVIACVAVTVLDPLVSNLNDDKKV